MQDVFRTLNKGLIFRDIFRAFSVRKFVTQITVPTSFCRHATLKKCMRRILRPGLAT